MHHRSSSVSSLLLVAVFALAVPSIASAQNPGGMETAPSALIKRTINETDPIKLLMDHKKPLALTKAQQDTMKALGKEMHHMEDLVYADIDKAAKKDRDADQKSAPARTAVSNDVQARITRLQDIQAAFKDRAYTFLTPEQRTRADSVEAAKRTKAPGKP